MKSTPDSDTTPSEKMRMFREGLRQVLTVPKSELAEREKRIMADVGAESMVGGTTFHRVSDSA
jgi:hypothetical protein